MNRLPKIWSSILKAKEAPQAPQDSSVRLLKTEFNLKFLSLKQMECKAQFNAINGD